MKKYLFYYLTLLLCFCSTTTPLFANTSLIVDDAHLLSDHEIEALTQSLQTVRDTYLIELSILTTNDTLGKSTQDYADDYFDYNDYGYGNARDGALLLIDMKNRKLHISTHGLATSYLDGKRFNSVISAVKEPLSKGDYYTACQGFVHKSTTYFKYNLETLGASGTPLTLIDYLIYLLISLAVGLVVAFLVRFGVSYRYKHPKQTVAPTLPDNNSITYSIKDDQFVSTHTTRVKIETPNHGGSSTHTSSSGRSHGGGGSSF